MAGGGTPGHASVDSMNASLSPLGPAHQRRGESLGLSEFPTSDGDQDLDRLTPATVHPARARTWSAVWSSTSWGAPLTGATR
jgi:hypothetical protein